jgi:hypothetical protein
LLPTLVSPFMPFDTNTKTTDIIMFNSRNLGALIVDEKPHVKSWEEPQYGIQNVGIEESYGFGVLNEGQAIAVAKNVKVRQNEMSTPASHHLGWSGDTDFQTPDGLTGVSQVPTNYIFNQVNRLSREGAELRSAVGNRCS